MSRHEANRLTTEDRDAISRAILVAIRVEVRAGRRPASALVHRAGTRAIGCDDRDLRDSELDEIAGMVCDRINYVMAAGTSARVLRTVTYGRPSIAAEIAP